MQPDFTIAVRRFMGDYCGRPEPVLLTSRVVRKASGLFSLFEPGYGPGEPETETPVTIDFVFQWLQEAPEQIERTVVRSGRMSVSLVDVAEESRMRGTK